MASMKARLAAYRRFLLGLRGFLNKPIPFEAARETLLRRLEHRKENFLRMVRQCVYDHPSSPYLPLLKRAQCSYEDMVSELAQHELEELLQRLMDAGVWISFEEFKGRKVLVRGTDSYSVSDSDFDNPLLEGGCEVRTGGSSGPPSRILIDLDFLEARASYEHVTLRLLDIYDVPMALWYPRLPASVGLSISLRHAKVGKAPNYWFDMSMGGNVCPPWHAWVFAAIVGLSRFSLAPLPWPRSVPLTDPRAIVGWIIATNRQFGRSVFLTTVSGATRICRSAMDRGVDLRGTQFLVGSEPLTASKKKEIESVNARVYLRYSATDIGTVAMGCGFPDEVGDLHLCSDTIALIPSGPISENEPLAQFCLTSFLTTAPKVMINVELGDMGFARKRRCGCLYDEIGFHTHLSQVRSCTRSTAEGIALPYTDLIRVSEGILPAYYGGSGMDYQWVEDEDEGSLTRLWLRVDPRLGPIDERKLVSLILSELKKPDVPHRFYTQLWSRAETIRVVRESPRSTVRGKTPAVVQGKTKGVPVGPTD